MSTFKSDFLNVLSSRGFVHQISEPDALDALAQRPGLTAYIGFDCTASSLHVGSLIQIMMLYWLQQTGGRPIALMGGGTTRVGDPSGKDESRRLLTDDDIAKNLDGIRAVFAKFLRFGDGPGDARMANNADWLNTLNYIDFLRDVGRHFSVNRMLTFDSVKLRLDRQQELSFLEFNYMILQAYDFVELYKRERCVLQMGGSDQWGNIVSGIDLGRRMAGAQLFALTTQLLTTSSGAKMGKTAAGAVWLNADMVSPYDYWQYWRNTEDADVVRFLKLFTVLPLAEIERLAALQGAEINEAKKVLATEATALVHGREAAEAAATTARQTFEEGTLAASLPTVEIARGDLEPGLGVLVAFAEKARLVASNGEARRQIKAGGLKINDETVTDEKAMLTAADLTAEGVIKLSLGKKRHVLLRPVARRMIEVSIPTAEIGQYVSSFNVGFGIITIKERVEQVTSAGSGTLVSAGPYKGILTAAHVLAKLPKNGEIALILSVEGPSIYRSTKINMDHTRRVALAAKEFGPDGPDLGFLCIPEFAAANLEALSGVFYNLSTRITDVLSDKVPSPDFVDVTVGVIHERTAVLPVDGKTQATNFEAIFCIGKSVKIRSGIDGHDLIEFEVTDKPDFPLPTSFEGMSGGSLWRFYLAMKDGTPAVIEKRIVGVPFYQMHNPTGTRLLTCQGPHSVYGDLVKKITTELATNGPRGAS